MMDGLAVEQWSAIQRRFFLSTMAKTRKQKEEEITQLEAAIERTGVVFFSYTGVTVSALEGLREKLRAASGKIIVAKRNLLLRALRQKGHTDVADGLSGPVALAVVDDEVAAAKMIAAFRKDHEQVTVYGGLLHRAFIDASVVQQLSTLGSKQDVLTIFVGTLAAPLSGFVRVLCGNMQGLLTALTAISEQKARVNA